MRNDEIAAQVACSQLIVGYCWAFDLNDEERLASLFTDDASWQRPSGELLVGQQQIRASFRVRAAATAFCHVPGSIFVELVHPTEARGMSLATVYVSPQEAGKVPRLGAPTQIVRYTDVFRLGDDGKWRIACRMSDKLLQAY